MFEFAIGFAKIVITLVPANFDYKILANLDTDINLLGGLYIMVRGQDNIVKALKWSKFGVYLNEKLQLGIS